MQERELKKSRRLFTSQILRSEDDLELDLAALYLAGEEYPHLDVSAYRSQLDSLAREVRDAAGSTDERSLIKALSYHLFDEMGFSGNIDGYYNPENNYLNRVLDTRSGVPVTLSLIYLEAARRLGVRCHGVGLPGHFLVRLEELDLYLDPFNTGELLSASDCQGFVRSMLGPHLPWRDEYLAPYSKTDILYRILNNLRAVYFQARDYHRAAGCLERMALINPSTSTLDRDLCWCYANTQHSQSAHHHLEQYVRSVSHSQEIEELNHQVESLWSAITQITWQSG